MSKRNLLNLSLLVFILILAVFVIYEPGKDKPLEPTKLTTLKVVDIKHLNILRQNTDTKQQNLIFEKKDNGWFMLQPYPLKANAFRIESILKILSAVSFSQNNIKKLKLATFGLDKPVASIILNKNTKIIFGNNRSLRHHRYVQIDSTLHLITDTFYYQLIAKVDSYISHKLLPDNSKIIKLSLPKMKMQQTDGRWQVTPKMDSFSADAINQLINEWEFSQSYDINKIKPAPKGKAEIIIKLSDGKTFRFKIANSKNSFDLINVDTGVRYILSTDRKNKLLEFTHLDHEDEKL